MVVDTNVISHALTPNQTQVYTELFKSLEQKYTFLVSGFTKFELTRSSNKDHRNKIVRYIKDNMYHVELSDILMTFASRLYFLYKKHDSTKGRIIGDGDIINAALAIAKNCPVLTTDTHDYPLPFFKETDRQRIEYTSTKKRPTMDMVYVLEPDMGNVKHCFLRHDV